MYRSFDMALHYDKINELLNNPRLKLINLHVSCSEETGYTFVSMRFSKCEERQTRFKRCLERFVLPHSGHPELDKRLTDKRVRLIKQHTFPTSDGVVVVLDYQVRKER